MCVCVCVMNVEWDPAVWKKTGWKISRRNSAAVSNLQKQKQILSVDLMKIN